MIGWKFESGKTLNRGHREKTANQKRKGSSKKTPVQRSAQYQTKGETMKEVEENRSAAYERGKEDALRGYSPQEGAEAYIEGYLTEASWPLYLKQRAPRSAQYKTKGNCSIRNR